MAGRLGATGVYLALMGPQLSAVLAATLGLATIAMLLYFLQRYGWLPNLFVWFKKPTDGFSLELEDEDPEHPRSPEEKQAIRHYYWAYRLDCRGRHTAAITQLRRAIELSGQWRFHLALASALAREDQYTEALANADQAKAVSPEQLGYMHWDIMNLSASIKSDMGRFAEAETDFTEAVRLCDTQNPEALWRIYKNWGTCRLQMDDYTGALEKYEQAWQLINFHCLPLNQELASRHARALFFLDRHQEALAVLERTIQAAKDQHEPVDPRLQMTAGMVNMQLQRHPEALQAYTQAGRFPRPFWVSKQAREYNLTLAIDACIGRGTALARQRKFKQAVACFRWAERHRLRLGLPVNPQLARIYATVLVEQHQAAQALAICDRALALLPASPDEEWVDLATFRCQVLFNLDRHGEGLPALDDVIRMRQQLGLPEDPDLHFNRAIAATVLGYIKAALAILDYVVQLRQEQDLPYDPDITFRKALACLQGNDRAQACQYARQALQEYMDTDPLHPSIIDIRNFVSKICSGPG